MILSLFAGAVRFVNIGAGIMQGFAVDASLGKSAANDSAGGRSQMPAIIAVGLTTLIALFLTPLLRELVDQLASQADPEVDVVVLDLEASSWLDVTSLDAMIDLQQDLASEDI